MNDATKQNLESAGINTEGLVARCVGNEALSLKLLKLFLQDENYPLLVESLKNGDRDAALRASHTLKGMTGNISAERLFALFSEQVARMRAGDWESAASMMAEISPAYETLVGAISGNLA